MTAVLLAHVLWPRTCTLPIASLETQHSGDTLQFILAVGVLSARDRFEQRQAQRLTWAGHALTQRNVFLRFVVGNHSCDLPSDQRLDEYSCHPIPTSRPDKILSAVQVSPDVGKLLEAEGKCAKSSVPLGLDFEVLCTTVVTDLGVFDLHGDGVHGTTRVSLWDVVAEKEIVGVTISPEQQGVLQGGFRYKQVPHYVFPAGFLGSVVVSNFSEKDPMCVSPFSPEMAGVRLPSTSASVRVLARSRTGDNNTSGEFPQMMEKVFQAPHYLSGSFLFHAHKEKDTKELRKEPSSPGEFSSRLEEEERLLQAEMAANSDVALVPVMDVYRNLPRKLLHFQRWLLDHISFEYFLKTDDDCFINIPLILFEIRQWAGQVAEELWWGSFRRDWHVERFGKWRELDYWSKTYPPFACGSGNVLSKKLVSWLAKNIGSLHFFQGEDISVGIWLSAVNVKHLDDWRWQCFSNCSDTALAIPNLTKGDLRRLWLNTISCGKVCGCG